MSSQASGCASHKRRSVADGEYKAKYDRAVREFNFEMKKKSQQLDDAMDEAQAEKKLLERKVCSVNNRSF